MRAMGCSFEPKKLDRSNDLNRTGCFFETPERSKIRSLPPLQPPPFASRPARTVKWRRTEGMPSWNECFRCCFRCTSTYCETYQSPEQSPIDHVCPSSLNRRWVHCQLRSLRTCVNIPYQSPPIICQLHHSFLHSHHWIRSWVRKGLYVYQLEWWLEHFHPSQLLVIKHEEVSPA